MDATIVKSDVSATSPRAKPAVPKKPINLMLDIDVSRKTHVRDMIRRLQEKEQSNGSIKPSFLKKITKSPSGLEKEEMGAQTSSQTLEDLKAIDEDIEKLRKQIEERDKIISALREAAEAKDKKLDNLMMECSKFQSSGKHEMDATAEPKRPTSSSPSSPPLCNGELCWTDSFVNKNYHEPVYAQLLNEHTALQKMYNDLREKLSSDDSLQECRGGRPDGNENAITFIMAEQIKALKEREAQLIWEAEELREQNDLMEFRILELEECRKEFLDKEMMNEGKHRGEKIVWRERDIEEVSDSGVMSLPTSEDLTSDSELGEAIRNYSPLGPLTNPGLSTPDNSHSEPGPTDPKPKKSLKSSECLQESGIFVDSESSSPSDCAIPTGTHSQACQTDSLLDKTLLDIIDSSCDLFLSKNPGYLEDSKSDDLTTEISKLSVIQKRIQQKTNLPPPKSPHTVPSCPHSNSLLFYEERLAQLEDKLKIYESTGDAKDALLAKRLQKEVELAHRVKELSDKVTTLEASRRKLEEEKCEFEEAENDARFQCQRLEVRLEELIEKNTELELELERQKVIMNEERRREKKKGSLEGLLNKYEQRNFELEEKELEARQRLNMIEAAMPAIVAYNVFKMVQNPNFGSIVPVSDIESIAKEKTSPMTDPVVVQRLEEVLNDQKKLRKDYRRVEESAADTEKALRIKIDELEKKAEKDREILEEMTNTLKTFKAAEGNVHEVGSPGLDELFDELKHMVVNEIQLRAQIEYLEQKEQAYMQSLENADEVWAGMEAGYKKRLKEAEEANSELQRRVSLLEETLAVNKTGEENVQPPQEANTKREDLINLQELLAENEKLKLEISRSLDEKFEKHKKFLEMENTSLKEELKRMELDSAKENRNYHQLKEELSATREELEREKEVGEKLRKDLEEKTQSVSSMEMTMQGQILELTQELNLKSKELTSLEVTVGELREEVETLENKVAELVETIQTSIKNQDEGSSTTESLIEHSWAPPTEEEVVSYISVDQNNPFRVQQVLKRMQEVPPASEIIIKKENEPPRYEVLIPRRFVVYVALSSPLQEVQFVFSRLDSKREIFLTGSCRIAVVEPPQQEKKQQEMVAREEEIFQLSLRNTELQQTLEKMEEESKWKDKEFEELQKIAMEIRQEQETLQELYKAIERKESSGGEELKARKEAREEPGTRVIRYEGDPLHPLVEEEPRKAPNLDIMQMINPIIVKASEQLCRKFSSLQIAFDNLQIKYRSKYLLIKPLLDQLRQEGDNTHVEAMVKHLAIEYDSDSKDKRHSGGDDDDDDAKHKNHDSGDSGDSDSAAVSPGAEFLEIVPESNHDDEDEPPSEKEPSKPTRPFSCRLGKSSSAATCASAATFASAATSASAATTVSPAMFLTHKTLDVDPDFSFVAPITIIRKVGDDGLFLEWDVSRQPETVTGFEVKVNGTLTHRVRSASRNRALLRPLNLKEKISIHVFAISQYGRSKKSSHVTYPDENFVVSTE